MDRDGDDDRDVDDEDGGGEIDEQEFKGACKFMTLQESYQCNRFETKSMCILKFQAV